MCYTRIMREWMREKLMRRRKKPVTNNSESTGKIGQEIPQDQPTPLQPSYPVSFREQDATQGHAEAGGPVDHPEGNSVLPDKTPQGIRDGSRDLADSHRPGPARPGPVSPAPANPGRVTQQPALVLETQPESLATPPAEMAAAASPKGYVVLAIGLPGSGKTTWFKRRGVTPLSSDMLRSILFDDITEQRYQGLVFSTLRSLLRARLIAKMPWNYVDATNLSPHERRQWIKMARSFGYEVHAVFFDVPFEVCMERNTRRDRMVNEESMRKMAERLRPPSFKEGFHKITAVRVKNGSGVTPTEDFGVQP